MVLIPFSSPMIRPFLLTAVLLTSSVYAQTIPVIGTSATLDVATWNIEDFGADGGPTNNQLQLENVLAVIRQSDIDLWGLQELNDEVDFDALLDSLGSAFSGAWVDDDFGNIGYGYVFRSDVINDLQISQILTGSSFEFAYRPPLQMRADVILPDTTAEVRFINLHMKAGGAFEDYERRVAASEILKNYIDNLQSIGVDVIVMGDLNDELLVSISSGRPSPYSNFLNDDDYLFATEPLDLPGDSNDRNTFCSSSMCTSGSVIDHIIATGTLEDDYEDDSADHFIELVTALPGYTSTTSDHLPVYARFDFQGMGTAVADEVPAVSFAIEAAYPNPFRGNATLSYTVDRPGPVEIALFDVLGRRAAVVASTYRTAGTHRILIDGASLAPGLYVARLTSNGQSAITRLVRAQ